MKSQGSNFMARQTSHVIVPQEKVGPQKPVRPRDPVASGERDAAHNRIASHNYFLLDKFEAGIALRGTEVKSIREGQANLRDSYGLIKDGEAFLLNVHIGPYSHGNIANHDETRTRKLLLHKEEVRKLLIKTQIKGHTLIPTRLYFRNGRVKCELAVAKGKQDWDKRETERSREADREARAAINASKQRMGR
jgi:SsrA-binding protein